MAPDVFVNMTIMANATEDFMKVMTLGCADTADRKVTSTRTVIN